MQLHLTNSLGGKKEPFVPLQHGKVGMYVCGITPYDYAHLGHGRCYVHADLLVRVLRALAFDVTYVRNFTDIDDKILDKAAAQGNVMDYAKLATFYSDAFTQDVQKLNCLTPTHEPRVTQTIPEIIQFVDDLIRSGHAYQVEHDVYFNVPSFAHYGKLSGRTLSEQRLGARIEVDSRKKDPHDFVLWKGNAQQLFWESPWGYGRPGWHIECSAMMKKHLGITSDIHGGGMDLIFPHHENEVAQSESLHNMPLTRYWVHNAFVNVNSIKMSKSLGNFVTLRTSFETIEPMALRFLFLTHHYRSPIDFKPEDIHAARTTYARIAQVFGPHAAQIGSIDSQMQQELRQRQGIVQQIFLALCDDLNMPRVWGIVFEHLRTIQTSSELATAVAWLLCDVVGLQFEEQKAQELSPEIVALLEEREVARAAKDWGRADALRQQLANLGYQVQDKKR